MLKPAMELPDDRAGLLRSLAADICTELIAMSEPNAGADEINAGLDRVHVLAEELWKLTLDVRAPHQ